ncbi:hypothetical protein NMG60_11015615 [Bertholletia excelsa]
MAIAGLQNASVSDSCFQWKSPSLQSRQWGNLGVPRTRASSILQLWRELENKHVNSHSQVRQENSNCSDEQDNNSNGSGDNEEMENEFDLRSQTEEEEGNNSISEQSADFGEAERKRLRQIFQKWTKSGDSSGIGAQRNIHRLCGRQALLDLLAKAKKERQRELHLLIEGRPVSNFSHRNRIQSLLKGRFLQIGRLIPERRPSPLRSSELDLLRQRNSISSLRKVFLSRLDNSIPGSAGTAEPHVLSNNGINTYKSEQISANISSLDQDVKQKENKTTNVERDTNELCDFPLDMVIDNQSEGKALQPSASTVSIGLTETRMELLVTSHKRNILDEFLLQNSEIEGEEHSHQLEAEAVFCEQHEHNRNEFNEKNTIEGRQRSPTSTDLDDWQGSSSNSDDNDWQWLDNVEVGLLRGETAEGTYDWRECTIDHQCQEDSESDVDELQYLQELQEQLHDNGLQQATDNLLEGPSAREVAPVERWNTLHFPNGNKSYNTEIRELLNRRRVSNLLQSDFCERLDQLILSYVERQARGSANVELDGAVASPCSPASAEQDVQLRGAHQNLDLSDVVDMTPNILPSSLEQKREIINDLRSGMSRLQHQLKNMQRIPHTCTDL